jgi:hypothetical protein
VSSGGLGVRLAMDLALPAFLSSVNGSAALALQLLPSRFQVSSGIQDPVYVTAFLEWQTSCHAAVPESSRAGVQKSWDEPLVNQKHEEVLSAAQSPVGRARLIAAAAPHSGDFFASSPLLCSWNAAR